jgi:hypothetical protein
MYFFYGLKGIVDLMIFFNFKLPEDLDYISLCVAVMAECMITIFVLNFISRISTTNVVTRI